jgi:hypothetical protein
MGNMTNTHATPILTTFAEIKPANIGNIFPEFGTSEDVRKYFGIKKGTL